MWRGVLTVTLLATSIANAQPARTTQLDTTGACPLANVEARTSELLGRVAITADAAARLRVETADDGSEVTATLTFIDENGDAQPSRTVRAASCDELAESVAIVISLVLREDAPLPRASAPPPAPVPAPPSVEPHDDGVLAPVPEVPRATALELGAATSTAGRSVFVLGGRLDRARLTWVADLAIALPEQLDVINGAVHVTSARSDAGACLRRGRFSACGLLGAGLVRARGEDLMDASTAVRPLASLAVRAEWRQHVSRHLGLRLFASVEQLLVRPRVLVDDTPIWSEPLVLAWLGGGIFFHMP